MTFETQLVATVNESTEATQDTVLSWDDHTNTVPYESSQWATSDRGWVFYSPYLNSSNHYAKSKACTGFYLDYQNSCSLAADKQILARAYFHKLTPQYVGFKTEHIDFGCQYFATVAEAKAWIEQTIKGFLSKTSIPDPVYSQPEI